MNLRVVLGRFLIRFGRFIQSLSIMVMRPNDLVEFSQQTYAKTKNIEGWGSDELIKSGLDADEFVLLENIPVKKGRLLLLGMGGGREAIPLARIGFEVTGVDFVEDMIKRAEENAARRGLMIKGLVQEISKLDVPSNFYDIAWLSSGMYSCVPTRKRRIEMLKRIAKALKSQGYLVCQYHWDTRKNFSLKVELARKIFALLTLGNLWYEKGDMLWNNIEFIHAFGMEEEIRSEFEAGGFETAYLHIIEESLRGGVVLRKRKK